MEVIFLFGNILNPIASLLGLIMNGIYEFFNWFGIQNIALCIFVFTFIVKMLMFPLTIKQQRFSRLQDRITPEVQKIQEKYKGKKDEASMRKQQAETQAVYQRYGASPTSGCLPMLITLPIMFALYRVINNIPDFVNLVREPYNAVATAIQAQGVEVLSDIATNFDKLDLSSLDNIIKSLAIFNTSQWHSLLNAGLSQTADTAIHSIMSVNNFFGLSITNTPSWRSISIIIPLLSMGLQFVQSKQLNVKTDKKNDAPNPMASMNVVMPIMSGFFCLMLPIGVGLYWIANSLFSIIQQYFVNKRLDSMDIEELVQKSQEKANKKLYKKTTQPGGASIQELAKKQTKSIDSVSDRMKDFNNNESIDTENDTENKNGSGNPTSIAEIANLLKNRNIEKGDK